jgi:hypothetical protein
MLPPVKLRSLGNPGQSTYDFLKSLINDDQFIRKVANNTYVRREVIHRHDAEPIVGYHLKYHRTYIVGASRDESGDFIVLDTGGWQTSTTKYRMNLVLPLSVSVWSENGIWLIRLGHDDALFFKDGMRIGFEDHDPYLPYLIGEDDD